VVEGISTVAKSVEDNRDRVGDDDSAGNNNTTPNQNDEARRKPKRVLKSAYRNKCGENYYTKSIGLYIASLE
jgi:hypothetical protein